MSKKKKSSYKRFYKLHPDQAEAELSRMREYLERLWGITEETEEEREFRLSGQESAATKRERSG